MSDVVRYAGNSFLLGGLLIAVEITAISMAAALIVGFLLATMRLSRIPPIRWAAWIYIWFVRGTPLLLQLVFLYNVLPSVHLGLSSINTALLGFSLNEAAFTAEIIRGGILSVSDQQSVAAQSLGMGPMQTMRFVVMPQAMRAILPALGNDAINLLKATSLASVIAVNELTLRSEQIVAVNFRFFTVFAAAGLLYLAVVSVMSIGQARLERRFTPERRRRERGGSMERFFTFSLLIRRPGSRLSASSTASELAAPGTGRQGSASSGDDVRALAEALARDVPKVGKPHRPYLLFENVYKRYEQREVLRGINLTIGAGEVAVIIGPSGAGKSTLLRLVDHLEEPDQGQIAIDGRHIGHAANASKFWRARELAHARADARIGFVFQHFNLFGHLTALENVALAPRRVYGEPREQCLRHGRLLLDAVGLSQRYAQIPSQLSGGQQQRVAIARALAIRPRLMLFDEPTSALDPELVSGVLSLMRELARAGLTMLVVTHELAFARDVADRVIFVDDGLVVEQGPPGELLANPRKERTQAFLRLVQR